MDKLIALLLGTVFLGFLSRIYNPIHKSDIERYGHKCFKYRSDKFMVIIIIWMCLFSGLKTMYNDTGNYIRYFEESAITLSEHFETSNSTGLADNPLYYITQVLVKRICNNYHVWFILISFLNSYSIIKLFKRYSVSFDFSVLMFISIGTYVMFLAAQKQALAVTVGIAAIIALLEHKWIKYFLLAIIAILFHTHAFMLLVLPLLLTRPWSKVTYITFAFVITAMMTYDIIFGTFLEFGQSIGATVVEDEVFDGHTLNPIRVLVYSVVPVFGFIFRKRLFTASNEYENLFTNMGIISFLILSIGLINGANLFARMAGYFEYGSAICLPWMIKKVFADKSYRIILVIASILYFVYFLYEFGISKNFDGTYRAITLFEFIKELLFVQN